jgi:aminopeptidase N
MYFHPKFFQMIKCFSVLCCIVLFGSQVQAQYTHADTLRGSNGPGRNWWNAVQYELFVDIDPLSKTVSGSNVISFLINGNGPGQSLQIDLQEPLEIDSVTLLLAAHSWRIGKKEIEKDGAAWFVPFPEQARRDGDAGYLYRLQVFYHGKPREAVKAPWDGGFVWQQSAGGLPWIGVACQGLGASSWYPCKDTQMDEPDSARMHFTCPAEVSCVSNGRLLKVEKATPGRMTYTWAVTNPINSYCIVPYIGEYVHLHDTYRGLKGQLDIDYWVLPENKEKAQAHFGDVKKTLEALEYWFGPYPFYADGYKLVDAPYLGMEHQSAIAYGNGYRNGYAGTDLSATGVGLKWDFIIVHESGHEWFGNSISSKDLADMWIHEAFTDYSETLFTEYWFGKNDANAYVQGLRKNIRNDIPIIGDYNVNNEGSGDMYYKGANMLHTIRQLVGNDSLFREMLRGLNRDFYHETVTSAEIEAYMSRTLQLDLKPVFDQYLHTVQVPELTIVPKGKKVAYRWKNVNPELEKMLIQHTGIENTKFYKFRKNQTYKLPDPNLYIDLQQIRRMLAI